MMLSQEARHKTTIKLVIVIGLFFLILGLATLSSKWVNHLVLLILSSLKGKPPAPYWLDKLQLAGIDMVLVGIVMVVLGGAILLQWSRLVSLIQNDFMRWAKPIGAILCIWLLIVVKEFSVHYIYNEVDVLPSVRQYVEPDWLPNDWYLNLDIGYRRLFNFTFGLLISWLGFQYGLYAARFLIYLFLAIAIYTFYRTFRVRFSFALLSLLFFLSNQSLIAGEWIAGGVETKGIAYAGALLSWATFFKRRYLLGFAFAGAALSFHVLVGLFALYCIAIAILLTGTWRSEWRSYIRHSWPFFITGIFGLQAVIQQLIPQSDADTLRAWEIYVQYRVPNHVLPSTWPGYGWIVCLTLATCLFLGMYFAGQSSATRFVAAYALGSVSLFIGGLAIYTWGETHLLRYYWFRFPDVLVPFISPVLIALVMTDFADGRLTLPALPANFQHRMRALLNYGEPIFVTLAVILFFLYSIYQSQMDYVDEETKRAKSARPALEWIAENTPKQAVFLVDPTLSEFYIYAQRARFVSFKHAPQSAADILDWYERIQLINGNRSGEKVGLTPEEELQTHFNDLDEKQIRQIANSYGINYYLGSTQQQLHFQRAYKDSYFTVYKLDQTNAVQPQ